MLSPVHLQAWRKKPSIIIESYLPFIEVSIHDFVDAYY